MIRKILKIIGVFVIALIVVAVALFLYYNEPLPTPLKASEERADVLAHKMLEAIEYGKYQDTRYLDWSFQNGKNFYHWDRKVGKVRVRFKGKTVHLNLVRPEESTVSEGEKIVQGDKRERSIQQAMKNFHNDSFWVVAPFKIFDSGTKRQLVYLADGNTGLLVIYTSGGSTPGDSYLWKLGPDGTPLSFKMWVSILPIGGLEVGWTDWRKYQSGAFLSKKRTLGPIELEIGNLKAYN
ncbi:MAG: hypothetical protein V7724_11495 [Sediminicola sp.]|tara:strand:+ start:59629 stop:60339 length:711 start_codon:yes stop_codon:yes gene_type:complete